MKLIRAAKHAFRFILYFTITTFFFFLLTFIYVNQDEKDTQIFVFIIFCAFYLAAIAYSSSDSHRLTDDISTIEKQEASSPFLFLDQYVYIIPLSVFSLHDRETEKHVENSFNHGDDESVSPHMECKNTEYDHEEDDGDDNELRVADVCNIDHQCGYEGDNEDNGDNGDEDFDKEIEEFIAVKKREWKEEKFRERLLCIEAANF